MNFIAFNHVNLYQSNKIKFLMSKVSFNNKQSPFFRSLKEKVDNYFSKNGLNSSGNEKLYFKSALQILSAASMYVTLVFFTPGTIISLILCCLLGVNLGIIGFNVMHEGGHNSFSKHKWLNEASGYFLNILGGNIYFWKIKHNVNHHTYTNIEGMDSDIDVKPFMRLHPNQNRYWFHKFQHVYWVILYGISYIWWIFVDDFEKYFSGRPSRGVERQKFGFNQHLIFWITKLFYISMYIVLPVYFVGLVPALIGFSIIVFICGLSISVVFQLAHVVEGTKFVNEEVNDNRIEQEWAIHQVVTTANFATRSKIVFWLLGGLNFQVEHHLFPRVSHIHYPQINILLKETCIQFNVPYLEYPSMLKAFNSHLTHIKKLGYSN
jgi:linoleoyl-CoA desaturase